MALYLTHTYMRFGMLMDESLVDCNTVQPGEVYFTSATIYTASLSQVHTTRLSKPSGCCTLHAT